MPNFRLIAIVVGTVIATMIVTNVLRMLSLESVFLLIEAGLLLTLVFVILIASRYRNVYSSRGEIQVPESLKNKMDPREALISRLTGQPGANWYLTNERLIRIQKNGLQRNEEEPVRSLPIQGLAFQYKTKTTQRKIALWALCALLSSIGILLVALGYLDSINYTYPFSLGMSQDVALFVGSAGFVVLFCAIIPPASSVSYYQFLHPNLEEADPDKKVWRIRETSKNKETLKQFLSDIERYSQNPSSPTE